MPELPIHIQKQLELEDIQFDPQQLESRSNSIYNLVFKRLLDFLLAILLLALLWPFYLIVALAVVIDSGFPVFYRADRGGYRNKNFRIFKFRSMVQNADKIGGGTTALNDSRITRVGAFLRKTKLDEIPQLLNIINGTMSFIGPRPELVRYTSKYDDLEKYILNVRPGITDISSLTFINLDEIVGGANADEMYEKYVYKRKNQLRLKYVSQLSLKTDAELFFATVMRVVRKTLRTIFRVHRKNEATVIEKVS